MTSRRWLLLVSTLVSLVPSIVPKPILGTTLEIISLQPALSRLIRHKVARGETLESIAEI